MSGEYSYQDFPYRVTWTAEDTETKYICACGQSQKFPFCDGAHKQYNLLHGTEFAPVPAKNPNPGKPHTEYICGCGESKKRPFCDGAHKQIKRHSVLPYALAFVTISYIWGKKLLGK